ncbi:MAG: hypothetical protein A2100_02385 [Sideroxydans sp. GWF2_59_14]|nr:MAG: hypothetical protein A2100_02385 [Sideroxydans sp. GWF2_59_14]
MQSEYQKNRKQLFAFLRKTVSILWWANILKHANAQYRVMLKLPSAISQQKVLSNPHQSQVLLPFILQRKIKLRQ